MAHEHKTFGIGIVGAGMAAKPHALALNALKDRLEVRGVWRRDAGALEEFCTQYGFPPAASYEAMLGNPDIDAILVLTPPNTREDIVRQAAAAGKHVLMEKPVERTTQAAERIVALCEDAGVTLGIIFQHRFRAASIALGKKIESGELGALHLVNLTVPWWRPQKGYYDRPGRGTVAQDGGGVLITQAIHSLDLMLSMSGPVAAVTSLAATTRLHSMETEDFVAGGLEFANGAVGSVMATTAAFPGGAETLYFGFEKAAATLAGGTLTINWHDGHSENFGEGSNSGGGADPMAFPYDWHMAQITDFIKAVQGGGEPRSTGRTALAVHRLIDGLIASSKDGRRVSL